MQVEECSPAGNPFGPIMFTTGVDIFFYFSLLSNNYVEGDKLIDNKSEDKLAETKTNGTKKIRNNSGSSSSSDEETNSQVVS